MTNAAAQFDGWLVHLTEKDRDRAAVRATAPGSAGRPGFDGSAKRGTSSAQLDDASACTTVRPGDAKRLAIPNEDEWRARGAALLTLLESWLADDPAYDLQVGDELEAGLRDHPVSFREVSIDE